MEIKDLQPKQGNVDIELDIVDVSEPREFEKFGKPGKVANAIAKDGSGDIKLSLWNEQVDQVKAGDKIKITNGWVSEWQGELQLSTGKFGQLEVIGESEAPVNSESSKEDKTQADKEVIAEEEDID